ncbi:histidine phosphatase family protein [Ramlibacter sp. H39-3-26]|uniref:histidine phosphatase family protein n=1 Tax=Curvibacter soli TaxID=3031331 RepID=UPI0023DB6159|nr:histidine phosphatase family protein [Ramlibacter sp. H39-3-26]MDF1485534.1 histidine phosphatase family protein [Ramlibacter sp. H39-3-26]
MTAAPDPGLERLRILAESMTLDARAVPFYFLRHGQTAGNARRIFQSPEEPLDATGEAQARRAAQALAGEPLAHIVCSDTARAQHTARIVAAAHGLPPQPRASLRERNFGALIGTSSARVDWNCLPEGGETLEQFVRRTRDALADALRAPAPVLVVAHGGTLYVLAALLRLALAPALLANARPLRLEYAAQAWQASPLLAPPQDGNDSPNIA